MESCKKSRVAFGDRKEVTVVVLRSSNVFNHCHGLMTLKLCKKSWNTGIIPSEPASYEREV